MGLAWRRRALRCGMTLPVFTALLDLDGTLIDSRPGIMASVDAAVVALGHAPDPGLDLTGVIGPPMDQAMTYILGRYGDNRVDEGVAAYRAHYGTVGLFGSTLYPGIQAALETMAAAGVVLLVATSKRTVFARRILEHLGVAGLFAGIHGAEPGGALDDKGALIGHVMRHEAIEGRCAMAGDRRYDIAGAHANGLRAVGVLWGYGNRDELETAGADRLVEQPGDLPDAMRWAAGG